MSIIEELLTFPHSGACEDAFFSGAGGGGESLRMIEPVISLLKASEDEKSSPPSRFSLVGYDEAVFRHPEKGGRPCECSACCAPYMLERTTQNGETVLFCGRKECPSR